MSTFATITPKPVRLHLAIVHGPSIRCPKGGASVLTASSDRRRVQASAKSFNSNDCRGPLKATVVTVQLAIGAEHYATDARGRKLLLPFA